MLSGGELPGRVRPGRVKTIAAAAVAAVGVAGLGALTTDIGPWYLGLRKPAWQPPDWLFGPTWTLIFALAATAGVLYWSADGRRVQRQQMLAAFALNAFLNTLWSLFFFRLKRPDWAFYEVGFLWLSILLLILILGQRSRLSAALLMPYLLWVSFAGYLNWTIVQLNGSFNGSV